MVVLVTDHFTTEALSQLQHKLKCEIRRSAGHCPSAGELRDVELMLIRSRTRIDKNLLELAPRLKAVVTATSGYDHIDREECEKRGVKACYTPDANFNAAAELTLMLMLSSLRRASAITRTLRELKWKDALNPGQELRGKTVGIIGLGRVGARVAELVKAFGAEVIAHDPYVDDARFKNLGIARLGLTEVYVQSDILSFHVPLTRETRHMLNPGTLEHCKEGFILINTSRGEVVDEGALTAALTSGQIAAAGLDVFEHEPLARESRLRKMPQVVLTPHVGAFTDEALRRASELAVYSLIDPSTAVPVPKDPA